MRHRVFFRADANYQIGFGHVYRLLSVYEFLRERWDCCFISKPLPEPIIRMFLEKDIKVQTVDDDQQSLDIFKKSQDAILVLDGYEFDEHYIQQLSVLEMSLVKVDDFFDFDARFDGIINHSPGAISELYPSKGSTELLLGMDYAMLRSAFLKKASARLLDVPTSFATVLVCFGGADPKSVGNKVCDTLVKNTSIKRIHVIGRPPENMNQIDARLEYHTGLNEQQMIALMETCDIAITAPSTVSLEVCAVGIPLILVPVEDNQRGIFKGLVKKGCANPLEIEQMSELNSFISAIGAETAETMLSAQMELIDGRSSDRFSQFFERL